jgi:hypothetical protein
MSPSDFWLKLKVLPMDAIIYHNPECGTSRNTLAMIRNAGIEPHVIPSGRGSTA